MKMPYFPNEKLLTDLGHALVAAGFDDQLLDRLIGNSALLQAVRLQLQGAQTKKRVHSQSPREVSRST